MLILIGILIIIAGFLLRFNPLLVIMASALATGLAAGLDIGAIIAAFGKAFNDTRYVSIIWIVLPVIGLLEAYGLQQHARTLIDRMKGATLGRLLTSYLVLRQAMAAVGLTSVAGHAQTVRPLVAPMSQAAAERTTGTLPAAARHRVDAMAAATDNVGLFFGEDVFIALGAVLLIQGFYAQNGIELEPLTIALWALPTAVAAFVIHALRIARFQRRLEREARAAQSATSADAREPAC